MSFTFFGILWSQRHKFQDIPGTTFGISLILLGVERFIAEFWRITPRVWGWMSAAQIFSIVACIVGIAMIFWMRARPRAVEDTALTAEPTVASEKPTSPPRKRRQRRR